MVLVTIRFDTSSVRRSGVVLMGLVAALLLGLWLFSVTRHFLFLVLLAWMFAVALEPGIKWLIGRGRSRGTATAIMGGGAIAGLAAAGGDLRKAVLHPDRRTGQRHPERGEVPDQLGQRPLPHPLGRGEHLVLPAPELVQRRILGGQAVRGRPWGGRVAGGGAVRPPDRGGVRVLLRRRRAELHARDGHRDAAACPEGVPERRGDHRRQDRRLRRVEDHPRRRCPRSSTASSSSRSACPSGSRSRCSSASPRSSYP